MCLYFKTTCFLYKVMECNYKKIIRKNKKNIRKAVFFASKRSLKKNFSGPDPKNKQETKRYGSGTMISNTVSPRKNVTKLQCFFVSRFNDSRSGSKSSISG
jgi:hypothetical protein